MDGSITGHNLMLKHKSETKRSKTHKLSHTSTHLYTLCWLYWSNGIYNWMKFINKLEICGIERLMHAQCAMHIDQVEKFQASLDESQPMHFIGSKMVSAISWAVFMRRLPCRYRETKTTTFWMPHAFAVQLHRCLFIYLLIHIDNK